MTEVGRKPCRSLCCGLFRSLVKQNGSGKTSGGGKARVCPATTRDQGGRWPAASKRQPRRQKAARAPAAAQLRSRGRAWRGRREGLARAAEAGAASRRCPPSRAPGRHREAERRGSGAAGTATEPRAPALTSPGCGEQLALSARSAQRDRTQPSPPAPAARPPAPAAPSSSLRPRGAQHHVHPGIPAGVEPGAPRRPAPEPLPQLGPEQRPRSRASSSGAAPACTSGRQHCASPGGEPPLRLPQLNSRGSRPPPPSTWRGRRGSGEGARGAGEHAWTCVRIGSRLLPLASGGGWTPLAAPGIGAAGGGPSWRAGAGGYFGDRWRRRRLRPVPKRAPDAHSAPVGPSPPPPPPFPSSPPQPP